MSEKIHQDKEWLQNEYYGESKTVSELAEMASVTNPTIIYWMEKLGVERRSISEGQILRHSNDKLQNKDWVRNHYVEKGKPTTQIAKELGVTHKTVIEWVDRHNIDRRTNTESANLGKNLADRDWLKRKYKDNGETIYEIGDCCGVSPSTVHNWLHKHGIETRSGGASGENHPNWSGGSMPYGKGWTKEKKREVRKRDGKKCVVCGMSQSNHINEHSMKLHVHHILKARDIDDPEKRNSMSNLITLCIDCHSRYEKLSNCGMAIDVSGQMGGNNEQKA